MIIIFGPAGAGKSVQGQILAARHDWRWLSIGQLLRDTHDIELIKTMSSGALVNTKKANEIMGQALSHSKSVGAILDGFPRELAQAKWLIESQSDHGHAIDLVVVLEVPLTELLKRLQLRGRADDSRESIEKRLEIYRQEIYPILNYFSEQKVKIAHIDGTGTVGKVHDRIEAALDNVH